MSSSLFSDNSYCQKGIDKNKVEKNDYCSLNNGCPGEKCIKVYPCVKEKINPAFSGMFGGKSDEDECEVYSKHPNDCAYKDENLKESYNEISFDEAVECVNDFAETNNIEYPLMKFLSSDTKKHYLESPETIKCNYINFSFSGGGKDRYCWNVPLKYDKARVEGFPFNNLSVLVGAESCKVYLNFPEHKVFKITDPSANLAKVNYSIDDARKCAEDYIASKKDIYKEYAGYLPGTLKISPDKGNQFYIDDLSRDWSFYHVWAPDSRTGRSSYIVVGAHTCGIYSDTENRLTRLQ